MKNTKKTAMAILVVSALLTSGDLVYLMNSIETMNLVQFLCMAVLIPCILISLVIASALHIMNIKNTKKQGILTAISGAVISAVAFAVSKSNGSIMNAIADNSRNMSESNGLSVTNIEITDGSSSFVMLFILMFALTMAINMVYNTISYKRGN